MLDELVGKYAWIDDFDNWMVAVLAGRTADDLVGAYGGDPGNPVGRYTYFDVGELAGPQWGAVGRGERSPDDVSFYVQVLERDGVVVAIENYGWIGNVPEVARRCSSPRGHFFSFRRDVNANGNIVEAIDGKVTALFRSVFPVFPGIRKRDREVRPGWGIGPETDLDLIWPTCMALMEQQTGVAFQQDWLDIALPTYQVPEPPDEGWAWEA